MAKLKIRFNCGCQFTESLEADVTPENQLIELKALIDKFRAALTHSSGTGHALEFHGEIREPPGPSG